MGYAAGLGVMPYLRGIGNALYGVTKLGSKHIGGSHSIDILLDTKTSQQHIS